MDTPDYAARELAVWETALAEQHRAEDALERARASGPRSRVRELMLHVNHLRMRADLLLAHAVKVRRACEDGWFTSDELTSTRMELPDSLGGH